MVINKASIRLKLTTSPALTRKVEAIVRERVKSASEALVSEFENHPVTQEIKAGPDSTNSSGTLGGQGNLFAFIGFDKGDDPTARVEAVLKRGLSFVMRKMSVGGKGVQIGIIVKAPQESELREATPMPWLKGRSWMFDVETGIGGLSNFMAGKFATSRSGGGIQVNRQTGAVFHPTQYISEIMKRVTERIKK